MAKVCKQHRWFHLPLAVAIIGAVMVLGVSSEAENGEPLGAEGLYRPPTCEADITVSCDDRFDGEVVSCHMRGHAGDEGYAIKACRDGRVSAGSGEGEVLERNAIIRSTDFGEVTCGREPDGFGGFADFCILCDTLKGAAPTSTKKSSPPPPGRASCLKIYNDGQVAAPGTCGAYTVTNDPGGVCLQETEELRQTFSDPVLGFIINIDGSDSGQPGAKDLMLCNRSWECLDGLTPPLATEAEVQQQQNEDLIFTPTCRTLSSGKRYCW